MRSVYIFGKEERAIQDETVIKQIIAGQTDAFRQLIEKYRPYVFRVALSVLNQPKDAEDAAQEAFIKIYFSLSRYQFQGFKTWMTRITVNTAIDYKRKCQSRKESLMEINDDLLFQRDPLNHDYEKPIELALIRKEQDERITRHLNEMPSNYRDVVIAYYMEEKTYQQIAQEQGIELKTVESKLYRARNWMKKHWKEEDLR